MAAAPVNGMMAERLVLAAILTAGLAGALIMQNPLFRSARTVTVIIAFALIGSLIASVGDGWVVDSWVVGGAIAAGGPLLVAYMWPRVMRRRDRGS